MNPLLAQNRFSPPYSINGLNGPTAEQGGASLCPPVPLSQVHRFKKAKMDFVDLMDRNLFPHDEPRPVSR